MRLNYGSLYAVVESLEKKGFIKATGTVRDGKRPERTIYQITDDGAREMNEWMTELISVPAKEYPAFMAGLSFLGSLHPEEALAGAARPGGRAAVRLLGMRGTMKATQEAGLAPPLRARDRVRGGAAGGRAEVRDRPRGGHGERTPRRAWTCGGSSTPKASTPGRWSSPSNYPGRMTRGRVLQHAAPGPHTKSPTHEEPTPEAALKA